MINAKTHSGRRWLKAMMILMTLGCLASGPTWAVLSDDTGQIQGRAPTVSGDLQVLMPDGVTLVTDNGTVDESLIPDQFTLSSSTAGLTPQDADGDTELNSLVDQVGGTLIWAFNGTPLTPAERVAPLGNNFVGQTLELVVTAPVTVSSTTGLPTTAGPAPHTTRYTLTVTSAMPGAVRIAVNKHNFGTTEGFPTTGFNAAFFDFWMNGTSTASNGDYTWTVNQSWLTVNSTGQVMFTAQPSSATKTATVVATDRVSGAILAYTFTVNGWFINNGEPLMLERDVISWCLAQELPLPTVAQLTNSVEGGPMDIRGIGSLYAEWGGMGIGSGVIYPGSGFIATGYWTSESRRPDYTDYVNLSRGFVSDVWSWSNYNGGVCWRRL